MGGTSRTFGRPARPFRPNATGATESHPNRPPRANTVDSRTRQPVGGKDHGKPTKPAKHSTGNNTATPHPNTPGTGKPQSHAPDAKQAVSETAYNNPTRSAKPTRATTKPQTSRPGSARATPRQHKSPGTS